ncbi:retrovirus-related Pol polyprotein from transposon 412 [Trichonephila clavipes]|nr:retrovirus-related Pol polyprotein from transposon 412 [Trichonephila clavipes]
MADVQDLKSALLSALKLEAATQASRRDRQSIRGARVNLDAPCESPWKSDIEKLRDEIQAFKAQRQNQDKRNFKCWGCGGTGHLRRNCPRSRMDENTITAVNRGDKGLYVIGQINNISCITLFGLQTQFESNQKIIAKTNILLTPRTECIIPGLVAENRKFRFGVIDYPDPGGLKAGVLIALSVVDFSNSVIPVRIANISDRTRTIQEGEIIAACAPVTCVDRKYNTQDLSSENLVKDLLQNTDLDEKQRCAAGGLIKEFQSLSLFSRTSEDFGKTRLTKHRIDTGEHPPIKQHPRRLPFAKQEEVQKLIKDMKNNDVIEPSSSPWASPIVLVRKKDGSTTFRVDYRWLNDITKKDSYPLLRIVDTLDTLAGNT